MCKEFKNIGMLWMQELFFGGGWITWNIVSDVYILQKERRVLTGKRTKMSD